MPAHTERSHTNANRVGEISLIKKVSVKEERVVIFSMFSYKLRIRVLRVNSKNSKSKNKEKSHGFPLL